jgi:hypothetical protein
MRPPHPPLYIFTSFSSFPLYLFTTLPQHLNISTGLKSNNAPDKVSSCTGEKRFVEHAVIPFCKGEGEAVTGQWPTAYSSPQFSPQCTHSSSQFTHSSPQFNRQSRWLVRFSTVKRWGVGLRQARARVG